MKRLRNTSGIADATVKEIISWIGGELGIAGFDVECRKTAHVTIVGHAYTKGSGYHSTSRPFIALRIGTDTVDRWQYTVDGNTHIAFRRSHLKSPAQTHIVKVSKLRYPTIITPYQYGQHKGKRYVIANRVEALVYLAAHELRHLWQAARWSDKRKSAVLPLAHGAKGRFSEIDTEAFAIHMLRAWRTLSAGSSAASAPKQPCSC